MGFIKLEGTIVSNNKIVYDYSVSPDLQLYFNPDCLYFLEYKLNDVALNLSDVPYGILAIPFVCNVLPLIWLTDSQLIIEELDKNFYSSISQFKKGFVEMYPDASFAGKVIANNLSHYICSNSGRSATFFSGGLDAWCTLVRHISETPDLILLWGADIPYTNETGWETLKGIVDETAKQLELNLITIKSSFRKIINEKTLDNAFFPKLHDGWWHGVQHGIALIGHSAPYNYIGGVCYQYIAASFSPNDTGVTCASYPSIDNYVKFFDCSVYHDAFISRSQKTKEIVAYQRETGSKVKLHVCWKTTDGKNCCKCEKCLRTIMGILLEGGYPENFGFDPDRISFDYMQDYISSRFDFSKEPFLKVFWKEYQRIAIDNKKVLRKKPYYKKIKWIEKCDFDNPSKKKKGFVYRRIENIKSVLKIFPTFT